MPLPAVLGLCLNSKAVYKPHGFIAQWQALIKIKSCYALWSVGVFYLFMSAMVSFPLSMGQKGSKIIQITLSLLMRSSAKCVLVFCRCAVVICRTGIEKEYLIFKKRLWKITSTFTLPQLSSPEILKGIWISCVSQMDISMLEPSKEQVGTSWWQRFSHKSRTGEGCLFNFLLFCLFLFPNEEKWNCACWNKPEGVSEGQTRRIFPWILTRNANS